MTVDRVKVGQIWVWESDPTERYKIEHICPQTNLIYWRQLGTNISIECYSPKVLVEAFKEGFTKPINFNYLEPLKTMKRWTF